MVTELERMGDLAAHVAKIARLRYPETAVPEALRPNFVRMGDVAEKMVVTAGQTLNDRNIQTRQELRARDEEMDELRRAQFRVLLSPDWAYGVEAAVDVALLGRYYERIADHAASWADGSSTWLPVSSPRTTTGPSPRVRLAAAPYVSNPSRRNGRFRRPGAYVSNHSASKLRAGCWVRRSVRPQSSRHSVLKWRRRPVVASIAAHRGPALRPVRR